MLPVVSIVGRPNVGKSTIFNRLVGSRKAIVDDRSGVTRDRQYGETYWNGREFTVIDTGGYMPDEKDVFLDGIRKQVHIALEESDLILFVVDVEGGMTSLDKRIARLLREEERNVLLVVNKADNQEREFNATEFYALGFEELYPISATSGHGTGNFLDEVVNRLPARDEEDDQETPKLAVVGRPNVGKSSFINSLLNDERCIVTDIPGTTRDSVNSKLTYHGNDYILVDTAGLRKKANVHEDIEFYSTVRTHRAIRECDVALLIIDAMRGFEKQDTRILREALKFNKGVILVLNKWDLVPRKDSTIFHEFEEYVYSHIQAERFVPIVSISATTKQRIFNAIDMADEIIKERAKEISTPKLNDFIQKIQKEKQLPMRKNVHLKIKYGTQVKSNPPVFKFFMNKPEELPRNYRKFIEHRLRQDFGFKGVPLTLTFNQK